MRFLQSELGSARPELDGAAETCAGLGRPRSPFGVKAFYFKELDTMAPPSASHSLRVAIPRAASVMFSLCRHQSRP